MGRIYLCCTTKIWYLPLYIELYHVPINANCETSRVDYQNKFLKSYVDIKSVDLRDVLREVLKDVSGIGLREDKPTVGPHKMNSRESTHFP